jgi:opacity protein-like surface antigen
LTLSGPVFDGFGDWLVGPAVWIRYNFVQPGWRVVPYLQGGLGLIFSDAYQDKSQDAIGTNPEFSVQAAIGARFLLDEHWSLDLEAGYEHISNADIAKRNDGVNALGASAGFTYFFDTP